MSLQLLQQGPGYLLTVLILRLGKSDNSRSDTKVLTDMTENSFDSTQYTSSTFSDRKRSGNVQRTFLTGKTNFKTKFNQ